MVTDIERPVTIFIGHPLFSTQAGQRLCGSHIILKVLRREGAKSFGRVGLKKRAASK